MKALNLPGPLVSTSWLAENLFHPNLIILDASMTPANKSQSKLCENSTIQIPRTQLFDFDKKICDQSASLPHMMPSPELFEQEVRDLGINPESCIVVYDRVGVYSAPRARWMFKVMGHNNVAILDGGFPAWISEGQITEKIIERKNIPGQFIANLNHHLICDADDVEAVLNDSSVAILDARSKGRFYGEENEPRAGLRSGHMPNAINLPFNELVLNGRMLPKEELDKIFSLKIKNQQKIITSCGSGVTACIVAFAAELVGYSDIAVYDGSWSEWGFPSSRPVVKD